ncbi:AAA family ATPase [Salipiger sp.]|uniref:AAA family ATPase n=1 Tax=Salipiger sp. TaxID=2078585 RepID=UPI003A96C21D
MKQDEFRKWLVAQGQTDATASSRVSSAKRVEQHLGDLDELFAQEDRDSILNRFAYSAEDERAERPNPSPVPIDGVLRTGLASLQQALKLYHSFLTEQSNVPDKAEQRALVDRLTRKEIDAAMQECDQLGLKAFLARGGFASPQVWVGDEGNEQSYPAKATVAAALAHLPDGRALSAKEFFNGFGEAQSFAMLEALGYQIRRKGSDVADHQSLLDRLSRKEIEAAIRECDEMGLAAFLARGGYADGATQFQDDATGRFYPAKATVAAALEHLPGGRALPMKEFFGGQGGPRTHAVLEKLGYRVLHGSEDASDQTFSRERIEAAMDAFDEFRASGAHADVFSGFDEPKTYWVRSTKARENRRFPTKPIVGYLLGKSAQKFVGGWSTQYDAAARLHAAGYIIVDQNDEPLPLPEQYAHLMRGADRARLVALNYFIAPAREAGQPSITIRAGDLHDMAGLVKNWANVCQALEGEMFQKLASVPAPTRSGPERSTTTEYTFVLAQGGAAKDKPMPHDVQTATTNLILYGPPGTGKTYQTAWEAVRLCLGEGVAAGLSGEENRDRLMAEYRRLMSEGRIEFVTFHQSMSYEEFVEGLRPSVDEEDVPDQGAGFRLEPVAGIFQRIARRAERGVPVTPSGNVISLDGRQVFKMSIARANVASEDYLFDEAISEGHTLLGWEDIDFTDNKFSDINEILKACREQGRREGEVTLQSGQVSQVDVFRNQLEIGDIIVVTKGNSLFRAIGEITGPYEYHQRANRTYCHRRSVRWLWVDRTGVPAGEIYDGNFTMRSIYALNRARLDTVALEVYMNSGGEAVSREVEPHVLIIDEINRANISKVFGELITLLEPDKRLGRRDEIQLTLPYSKKRFGVPPNLHIIGTMNTADRSIALLDTALRRRFTFKELMPNPSVLSPNVGGINMQKLLTTINDRIEYLFDREHQIGHAYFTGCKSAQEVEDVMRHKVIPLLSEYFYEDWSKVAAVLGDGPQGPSRFLEARRLTAAPGLAADDFGAERLRWRVKDQFDFSEFAA